MIFGRTFGGKIDFVMVDWKIILLIYLQTGFVSRWMNIESLEVNDEFIYMILLILYNLVKTYSTDFAELIIPVNYFML